MDVVLLGLRILAALALYGFLGTLLAMLWRDLRGTAARDASAQPSARLVVVETTDDLLEIGAVFTVQPVTSIGRGAGNTVSIPDGYASTQHALLSWRGGQWWLEDQGSRNGTLLNGAPVTLSTVVSAGDIVSVGRTSFRFERDDGSRPGG